MTRNTKYLFAIPAIAILMAAAWVAPAIAAVDMFIKIEGIDGESRDKDHSGWIEVESFSWGSQGASVRGRDASRGRSRQAEPVMPGSLTITKSMDQASTSLMRACSSGKIFDEVIVDLLRTDEKTGLVQYTAYTLLEVRLTSCASSGSDERSTENVTLNYSKIDYEYTPVDRGRGKATKRNPYAVKVESEGLVSAPVAPPVDSIVRTAGYAFPGGTITGVVLAPSERAAPNVPISVGTISGVVIETQTDEVGRFKVDVPSESEGQLTVVTRDIASGFANPAVMEIVTYIPSHISREPKSLIEAGEVVDVAGHYTGVILEDPHVVPGTRDSAVPTTPVQRLPDGPTSAEILADTGRLSLPTVSSIGPGGSPAITRYSVPSTIPPGNLVTVMTDSDGEVHQFDTTTYTTTGSIDSNRLQSGEATDFTFEFQFPPGFQREVGVMVVVTGAVTYEQSGQLQRLRVAADGSTQLVGTVKATAATPSGLPFSITPTVVP